MKEKLIVSAATLTCLGLLAWRASVDRFGATPARPTSAYRRHLAGYNYSHPMGLLPANDYHALLNYSFTFGILPRRNCPGSSFLLLVLVHSSPDNFRKRTVIRDTWGSKRDPDFRLYFLMGRTGNLTQEVLIKQEVERHGDIVQGNFLDRYRNLTYKHVMSLKYALYHCPRAKYVLKTDDDVFVHVPQLNRFLTRELSPYGTSGLLYCSLKKSAQVLRTYRSKWRVGFEEYPERTYPPYCPGWAVLYSPDVAFALYRSAQNCSRLFWIDDVLITGILARENNFTHTDSSDRIISKEDQIGLVNGLRVPQKPFLFGRPDLNEIEIRRMWEGVRGDVA
ncbi:beta-1,3-galactosyltransferase 5-like isoform X2 [Anthonomus grandis grandis]|nr:beta-1,3-galactosyltransferase 5-like isoform X2 [Anthonomus grandis grandis]